MDKPVSSERYTQNSKGQWSRTATEDDPFERKEKILHLHVEQVLPGGPQGLRLVTLEAGQGKALSSLT